MEGGEHTPQIKNLMTDQSGWSKIPLSNNMCVCVCVFAESSEPYSHGCVGGTFIPLTLVPRRVAFWEGVCLSCGPSAQSLLATTSSDGLFTTRLFLGKCFVQQPLCGSKKDVGIPRAKSQFPIYSVAHCMN